MTFELADLPAPGIVDVADGTHLSRSEASALADALAADLAGSLAPGTAVSFVAPPRWTSLIAFLGCWRAGMVAAPLHSRLSAAEQAALRNRLPDGSVHLDDVAAAARRGSPGSRPDLDPGRLGVLLATSGSSGRPKLVRHRADRLAYKAGVMADVHALHGDDVVLMPAPMAHVSGLLNGLLLPGRAGMTTVLLDRWAPDHALDLVRAERVSFMIGPPTYFVQMLAIEPEPTVPSLRLISCGGAGVTREFAARAAAAYDAVAKRTYGSTEAPTVTTSHAGDPAELGWSTDGRPVGDVELRIVDDELQVRGSELFVGYDDEAATAAALDSDGWYRTGDRARIDAGWLTILGRIGDTIIRGGENVDPAEVESVCASLPGVGQAVVVGYPDETMGERIGLVVVGAEPSLDDVRAHCAAAGLARFKTPERVIAIDVLPVLTVGKPDRAALRTLLESAG